MWMWIAIMSALFAAFFGGILYISFRAAQLPCIKTITGNRRKAGRFVCFLFFSGITILLSLIWNVMNAVICLVHLVLFWMICDLSAWGISKLCRAGKEQARSAAAVSAIVICILYLTAGWVAAHHVRTEFYTLKSDKLSRSIRIVQLTDSHIGATFHADGLGKHIEDINLLSPDIVVVTGDFVDDDTSRTDMLEGCAALGRLNSRYGVFFVYGNHDRGYSDEATRGWTNRELQESLLENGIIILEDNIQEIGDDLCIIGREDRSWNNMGNVRKTAGELMEGTDKNRYIIFLDHQPSDFDAEAEAGADLVMSGHTHGGQFFPINRAGEWIGENCRTFGYERRIGTDFIVSSGISCWAFKFKTGCHSEYAVVDIAGTDTVF